MLNKKFEQGTNIICHGDGDGLISAASLKKAGCDGEITITQPFLLHKLKDLQGPTAVVDIAVDNRNPEATIEWVRRNLEQILCWIDHHEGGEALQKLLGEKFVYNSKAPSCPQVLKNAGYDVPQEWVDAGNACDRPTDFEPTDLSARINNAFKVALVDLQDGDRSAVDTVQRAQIDELVSGQKSDLVEQNFQAYGPLLEATESAAASLTQVVPGIVAVTLGAAKVDKTKLFTLGYKQAPVVVIQSISAETGEAVTTVATNKKDLDLVKKFGFKSGAPFRVTLTPDQGADHEAQLKLVVETLGEQK